MDLTPVHGEVDAFEDLDVPRRGVQVLDLKQGAGLGHITMVFALSA
jgi:hypothetical protein